MSERLTAVLDQIEAEQQERFSLPDGITALPLLQMAYRGQVQLTPQQMRAAIEALPFEVPKLSASANVHYDGTFAAQLERAIERSRQGPPLLDAPKTIEHEELVTANDLKAPFQRNFRRFTSTR